MKAGETGNNQRRTSIRTRDREEARMSTQGMSGGRSGSVTDNIPPAEVRKVVLASSVGTVFEWYDFYLYGSLAAIISKQFFSGVNPTAGFIFALLAFAAGFAVRPFGAIVFGRLGDLVGRKYTFLITIVIMGLSTALVGVLPGYATIGVAAPFILVALRLLQGLALGGEYGGAAISSCGAGLFGFMAELSKAPLTTILVPAGRKIGSFGV